MIEFFISASFICNLTICVIYFIRVKKTDAELLSMHKKINALYDTNTSETSNRMQACYILHDDILALEKKISKIEKKCLKKKKNPVNNKIHL